MTHDTRLARVELNGVEGVVLGDPDWDVRVYFVVRADARAADLRGFDARGAVVLRKNVGCGVGSVWCGTSSGSGGTTTGVDRAPGSSAATSGGSGDSSGGSASTATTAP